MLADFADEGLRQKVKDAKKGKGTWPYVDLLFWSLGDQIPALTCMHHILADQVHALMSGCHRGNLKNDEAFPP